MYLVLEVQRVVWQADCSYSGNHAADTGDLDWRHETVLIATASCRRTGWLDFLSYDERNPCKIGRGMYITFQSPFFARVTSCPDFMGKGFFSCCWHLVSHMACLSAGIVEA